MNKVVNKVLLAGDRFMPQVYLRQPGFSDSAFRPFRKNKERIQKFKDIRNSRHIYQNKLDKACFQHEIAYRDFKDLPRRRNF